MVLGTARRNLPPGCRFLEGLDQSYRHEEVFSLTERPITQDRGLMTALRLTIRSGNSSCAGTQKTTHMKKQMFYMAITLSVVAMACSDIADPHSANTTSGTLDEGPSMACLMKADASVWDQLSLTNDQIQKIEELRSRMRSNGVDASGNVTFYEQNGTPGNSTSSSPSNDPGGQQDEQTNTGMTSTNNGRTSGSTNTAADQADTRSTSGNNRTSGTGTDPASDPSGTTSGTSTTAGAQRSNAGGTGSANSTGATGATGSNSTTGTNDHGGGEKNGTSQHDQGSTADQTWSKSNNANGSATGTSGMKNSGATASELRKILSEAQLERWEDMCVNGSGR